VLLDSAGDAAQMRLFGMETRLSDQIQQQLGSTNTMIGDLHVGIGGLQRQMMTLEGMFQQIGERLTSVEGDIADLQAYRDELPSPARRDLIDELRQNTAQIAELAKRVEHVEAKQRALGAPAPDNAHERG
jgi:chromosome segregation ATPase